MDIPVELSIYTSVSKLNDTWNTVCFESPTKTVSDGIWVGSGIGTRPMKALLPTFEMQILIIFVITEIFNFVLSIFGFPSFVSQMAVGLLLGSVANKWPEDMFVIFPYGTHDILTSISSLGYVFFIFLNGVQMDFSMIVRTGKKPWAIAVIGILIPIFIGFPILLILSATIENVASGFGGGYKDIYIALMTNSVTMFAVTASLLNELRIQNSKIGRLALTTALVMDILSSIVTSHVLVFLNMEGFLSAFLKLASLFTMVIFVPLVCRPMMLWIVKNTPEGRPVRSVYLQIIVILVLFLGWCSVKIEQDFVLGAFILGLCVPEGPPLGSALVQKFQFFGHHFLLPIFVTTSMMKVDIFMKFEDHAENLVKTIGYIILFTHLVKIVSCLIPSLYCKMPFKDAFTLSLILNCKGVVDIGIYSNLYDTKMISSGGYTVMMVSVMIIATIVQISVKLLYDPSTKYAGYQRRNIMNSKPYSELNVVACIHKPFHVSPITNILDLCCPTSENPIIVNALHLVELIGSSLPIFISHGLHKKNLSKLQKSSYSHEILLAFDMYEHDNVGTVKIHTYTAISPSDLMYEDVCNLALDKVASIIFLPFHQRWKSDGTIDSDDKNIRTLNKRVLEISPCSVGILVTRAGNNLIRESSITRLAMIFITGKDDREGLCIAKRASMNPNIQLTVYHLMSEDKDYYKVEDENLRDKAVLRDIGNGMHNVTYQKIILNDGPQTASFLHDIVNEHDYFIVGRRHGINSPQTRGLSDWSEFPELGPIGDYLSSPDFKTSASVLVVGQQVSRK